MQHIMLDLETMDNKPTAAIVAIGAVVFDLNSGTIGKHFYRRVDLKSSMKQGGTISADTIKWWLRQSAEARSEIVSDGVTISGALLDFRCFITRNCHPTNLHCWAKGTDFDIPIITSAFNRLNAQLPWKSWNVRDVRTIEEVARGAGMDPRTVVPFEGEKHNALDDAIHQAKTVMHIWQQLMAPHSQDQQP